MTQNRPRPMPERPHRRAAAPAGGLAGSLVVAVVLALAGGLPALVPPAAGQPNVAALRTDLRVTERLLATELGRYQALVAPLAEARSLVARSSDELGAALATGPVGELRDLETTYAEARARLAALEAAAAELRQSIYASRDRILALRAELDTGQANPTDLPDPLSGPWLLTLRPQGREALMDLYLDGTLVSGTIGLDDGTFGSVRGTFVDGRLRLERVSAEGGLDLVLEGELDEATGNLAGEWRPTVHGRGEPAGGRFVAVPSDILTDQSESGEIDQ